MKSLKILFLTFSLVENDVRTQELLKIMNQIGEIILVSPSNFEESNSFKVKKHFKFKIKREKHLKTTNYVKFIYLSIKASLKTKNADLIFIDNYLAAFPALIILKFKKIKYIIQDVRELYLLSERKGIFRKLLTKSEIKLMKKADLVIVANEFRAKLMKQLYDLKNKLVVFENIRKLDVNYDSNRYNEKYKFINNGKIRLIYTGGFNIDRRIDELVKIMGELKNCDLIIAGGGSKEDKNKLQEIIRQKKLSNVYLFEKLPLDELKYLINNSHIGVVSYNNDTYNNRYCASGKVYEFLFEGIPLITTENPPLKSLCKKYKVGEADNNFLSGINKIINNYQFYKNNVLEFIKNVSIENNRTKLLNEIKKLLKSYNI